MSSNVGMEDVPESDPLQRPVSGSLLPDDGMWCGMLRASSPENLLHDLLSRAFTPMHCYRMDEAPRDQHAPRMEHP